MTIPRDPVLQKAVRDFLGGSPVEMMVFFDLNNTVRHVLPPFQIAEGAHLRHRREMEKAGELKAIAHIHARGHGRDTRMSMVEYLPTGDIYEMTLTLPRAKSLDATPAAIDEYRGMWDTGEEVSL